ncbi:acetoin utilization protein AcuC [Gorillibacterium sp. sgz5001074]|uniref:acetoin utilization protein AcuC n=1 Tax=Gorillibacterium sp. sgz5001074 TaxID=3446695 RepID=UPI003F67A6AE
MEHASLYIYGSEELKYRFHEHHPFNQHRLEITSDLLRSLGALPIEAVRLPRVATPSDLLRVHQEGYVRCVEALSGDSPDEGALKDAEKYGLTTEDTPFFPGIHEASARIAGGTVQAALAVMNGECLHALHLGGGLHHALAGQAAGFCVYNDASVAIAAVRAATGARVLYIDTDVHHGDGVQWSFYSDPDVCTLSIHETGKYLFPGTGFVHERGDGQGFGFSINVPVEPYTEDASWLECFGEALERTAAAFRPDLILSQHGCDAHAYDPLSHIHCSMDIYLAMPRLIHRLAHRYCGGRWVALGGGGYDIWRVVPRAWSLLWLEMIGHPLPDLLRQDPGFRLPEEWLRRWQPHSREPLPPTWLDPAGSWEPMPRRTEITEKNRRSLELALQYLPPAP